MTSAGAQVPKVAQGPSLEGKVALITGGSRGLGREMAFGMAAAGADVAIVSRKVDNCASVAAEIESQTGRRAFPFGAHVGRWSELDGLVDAVYAKFGRVDVLVNNAGMSPLYPSLLDVSEDLFDKIIGVNMKGPFRLAALVGSRMFAGDGGSIINISSVAAIRPTQHELPYAAAKSGLDTFTVGFAREYGPKVRVNSIMCGPFLTDISAAWDMDAVNEVLKAYPLRRGGEPAEIVGTALYLASDASSYTTGSVIRVDGGQAVSY